MPLVLAGPAPDPDPLRVRARKIRPEYARGDLVRVAGARHQAEAEMIQILLLEEGVPSVLRRSAGFDVPDFLAAGPRDVLAPESGARAARDLLGAAGLGAVSPGPRAEPGPGHAAGLVLAIAGGGLVAAALAWALLHLPW
jgi:hypothetical protein